MKKNDCLQTPRWVYESLGQIDLDPCASHDAKIGIKNYVLAYGDNGLELEWNGFVYCNPPFSQKHEWIKKMQEHRNGILILPERGSAPWFGPLAKDAGCYFVLGRKINFIGGPSSNNLGGVLFLFGSEARKRVEQSKLTGHLVEVVSYNPR
jgi:hypothetical protein